MIENASGGRLSIKQTVLIVAGLVLITSAVRIPLLGVPFERDEGEYAYIAWRLGHHELPYRDWVDQKPPAIFWVYRAALAFPMDPIRAVHFAAFLFSAASACALFFVGRRFLNSFWAFIAAAVFILLSADPWIEGTAANTEIFMLLPLILSQLAFFRAVENPERNKMSILLCGALIGIATAFKQVAAVNWLLVVAAFPIFAQSEKRWRDSVRFACWSAVGVFAIAAITAVYFWIRHGFEDLVQNVVTHNLEYIGAMSWSDRFHFCADTLARLSPCELFPWIFAALGLVGLIATRKIKWLVLLVVWLIASAIAISSSGYFFPHYFQQWLPPLVLLSIFGAAWLSGLTLWKGSSIPPVVLIVLLAALPLKTFWPFWFSYSPADSVRKIYPGNFFAEMPAFAERIAKITTVDQRVFAFGAEPELLFYARRVSATRYIFLFPLYGPYRNIREKQVAVTEEIQRNSPAAAVYVPNGLFFAEGTDQYFTEWCLSYFKDSFAVDTWLIKETETSAAIVPARPDLPPPHQLLGAIFVKKSGTP
ncbi:MAG TPA: glycosyltransferase family 39 protein [Chthoniobacterales bacterium]